MDTDVGLLSEETAAKPYRGAAGGTQIQRIEPLGDLPIIAIDMPVMYEDEGQEEMGESILHVQTDDIIRTGLLAHFSNRPDLRVFTDLNMYYHPIDLFAYVSPDD